MYLDAETEECTACPVGCAECESKDKCTACNVEGTSIDPESNLCVCGPMKWLFQDGEPACHSCIEGCATCSNEYKCDTFAKCPHPD